MYALTKNLEVKLWSSLFPSTSDHIFRRQVSFRYRYCFLHLFLPSRNLLSRCNNILKPFITVSTCAICNEFCWLQNFINEAETLLNSSPNRTGGTPGVIGAQEVYRWVTKNYQHFFLLYSYMLRMIHEFLFTRIKPRHQCMIVMKLPLFIQSELKHVITCWIPLGVSYLIQTSDFHQGSSLAPPAREASAASSSQDPWPWETLLQGKDENVCYGNWRGWNTQRQSKNQPCSERHWTLRKRNTLMAVTWCTSERQSKVTVVLSLHKTNVLQEMLMNTWIDIGRSDFVS